MTGHIAIVAGVWLVYGVAPAAVVAVVLFALVIRGEIRTTNDRLAALLAELIEQGEEPLVDNVVDFAHHVAGTLGLRPLHPSNEPGSESA